MNQSGAEIIPFPACPAQTEWTHSAQRLATALSNLSGALKEQAEALHRWRDALHAVADRTGEPGPRIR